jgi:hypothetical protein
VAKSTAILDAALAYVAAGLPLLPLKGKAPATKLLPTGDDGQPSTDALRASPATEREVRTWFANMPSANIGVFTGAGSAQVLAVDLDPGKCPDPDRASRLRTQGGPEREIMPGVVLPSSPLHVLSGGGQGGRHLYYRHPPMQVRCVTRVGHAGGSHVDVQAEGRYLVLPPSIHPVTGQPYLWVDGEDRVLSLEQVIALLSELPPAPEWAIRSEADDRAAPEAPRVQSGQWIAEAWTLPIPEGGRRDGTGGRKQTLRSLVQWCAKTELPRDVALAQLHTWNKAICRPPLPDHEIESLTAWIYERVARERAIEISDRVNLRLRGPRWPHDLFLGTRFGRWTDAVARSRGTHPDLVAVCGLGALGVASTGGYKLHYLDHGVTLEDHHWIAPSALWIMPVMESGGRKSAAYREIEPLLQSTNTTLGVIAQRFNAELDALTEDLQAAKKAASARMGENREAALEARREITQQITDLPQPLGMRWILSDATPEAFLRALGQTEHLGLLSEEGDETVSRFFGHYSGAADMNGVLKSWDGGITTQARIGRGMQQVAGVASILAMVQPRVLSQLGGANAEDRGLMARFLFAVPPPMEPLDPDGVTKTQAAIIRAEFADVLHAVYYGGTKAATEAIERAESYRPQYASDLERAALRIPESGPPAPGRPKAEFAPPPCEQLLRPDLRRPVDVVFAGECIDALKELEAELKTASIEGAEHFTARTWTRKAHEHAMRIAAVLQLSETPPVDHEPVIMALAWVQRAIALVKAYFIPHYYIAKDLIASPPHAELGIHILTHFAGRDSFTASEAADLVSKRTPDIRPVLEWLGQTGALRLEIKGKALICYPLANVSY